MTDEIARQDEPNCQHPSQFLHVPTPAAGQDDSLVRACHDLPRVRSTSHGDQTGVVTRRYVPPPPSPGARLTMGECSRAALLPAKGPGCAEWGQEGTCQADWSGSDQSTMRTSLRRSVIEYFYCDLGF
jgi:hypothetical protein